MATRTPTADQGFRSYGAKLFTPAGPYDPSTRSGDRTDPAQFVARPGVDFQRPWLAIQNDIAFQWPLGLQGFELSTEPQLGLHHFIGDNKVVVDVVHTGDERIALTGSFPGLSSSLLVQSLREVVRRDGGELGKILFIPEIMTHAQRVQVVRSQFSRGQDARGKDMTYSIDFVIVGLAGKSTANEGATQTSPASSPTGKPRGSSGRIVSTNSKYNTLRKVAAWKLHSSIKWRQIYDLNEHWFTSRQISIAHAPDYRLPIGTKLAF